jgi:hypothetical protein
MNNIRHKKNNHNSNLMLKILIIHISFSFLIYILYKIFPNIFHEKIITLMPSRLFLIHSFLGTCIIISISLYFLLNFFKNNKFFYYLLFFLILIHPIIYFEKYLKKINILYSSLISKEKNYDIRFWKSIESEKFSGGYFLSSADTCSKTIQKSKKPLLICIESIDYLPYIPNLISPVSKIIHEVYEVNFNDPPEKNHGGLWYDRSYKEVFENRLEENWVKISQKFNLNGLIVPKSWELNLDKTFEGDKYAYYKF